MIMSMKNSNDTIGNRTRDLPACIAEPQPTAPPRGSMLIFMFFEKKKQAEEKGFWNNGEGHSPKAIRS